VVQKKRLGKDKLTLFKKNPPEEFGSKKKKQRGDRTKQEENEENLRDREYLSKGGLVQVKE